MDLRVGETRDAPRRVAVFSQLLALNSCVVVLWSGRYLSLDYWIKRSMHLPDSATQRRRGSSRGCDGLSRGWWCDRPRNRWRLRPQCPCGSSSRASEYPLPSRRPGPAQRALSKLVTQSTRPRQLLAVHWNWQCLHEKSWFEGNTERVAESDCPRRGHRDAWSGHHHAT